MYECVYVCIFPPVVWRVNAWLSFPACLSRSSLSSAHSGRLPVRVGLGARDAAPRPGGEGPQGARSHQLAAPPARRQARTANILPLRTCPVSRHRGLQGIVSSSRFSLYCLSSRPSHVTRRHGAQLGCRWVASGFQASGMYCCGVLSVWSFPNEMNGSECQGWVQRWIRSFPPRGNVDKCSQLLNRRCLEVDVSSTPPSVMWLVGCSVVVWQVWPGGGGGGGEASSRMFHLHVSLSEAWQLFCLQPEREWGSDSDPSSQSEFRPDRLCCVASALPPRNIVQLKSNSRNSVHFSYFCLLFIIKKYILA